MEKYLTWFQTCFYLHKPKCWNMLQMMSYFDKKRACFVSIMGGEKKHITTLLTPKTDIECRFEAKVWLVQMMIFLFIISGWFGFRFHFLRFLFVFWWVTYSIKSKEPRNIPELFDTLMLAAMPLDDWQSWRFLRGLRCLEHFELRVVFAVFVECKLPCKKDKTCLFFGGLKSPNNLLSGNVQAGFFGLIRIKGILWDSESGCWRTFVFNTFPETNIAPADGWLEGYLFSRAILVSERILMLLNPAQH